MNLSHLVRQAAQRYADEIAFVWGDRSWTWEELDKRVDAMAAALSAQGIGKGDRVLVQSTNCNQMFESMFASFRIDAIWVPTNFRQTPTEVAYLAEASGAVAMICHAAFPEHAKPGTEASEADLLAWLDGKVSRYKLPKRVFFWDAIPRSAYGKITKIAVRSELEARGCM